MIALKLNKGKVVAKNLLTVGQLIRWPANPLVFYNLLFRGAPVQVPCNKNEDDVWHPGGE
jgi:hypothetical protein